MATFFCIEFIGVLREGKGGIPSLLEDFFINNPPSNHEVTDRGGYP